MASYTTTLAKSLKWSERFIQWELPLPRGLQYRHALLRAADVWTVPPEAEKPPVSDADVDIMLWA